MDGDGDTAEDDEYDVAVTFVGPDFALTVPWSTDDGTDDERRAIAASEWFAATYGFAPIDHAVSISIEAVEAS